jgi:hypothetical protein
LFTGVTLAQSAPAFGITVVIPSGLEGKIYHLRSGTKSLPDFSKMKPKGSIYTTTLNVPLQSFDQGFPGVTKRFEWFAIDYTGRFWVDKPGLYGFVLLSDDGSKLYIDDQVVIDNDGLHSAMEQSGEANLAPGIHRIQISYFQGPRNEVALVLHVRPPGEPIRVFDTNDFKPPQGQIETK